MYFLLSYEQNLICMLSSHIINICIHIPVIVHDIGLALCASIVQQYPRFIMEQTVLPHSYHNPDYKLHFGKPYSLLYMDIVVYT